MIEVWAESELHSKIASCAVFICELELFDSTQIFCMEWTKKIYIQKFNISDQMCSSDTIHFLLLWPLLKAYRYINTNIDTFTNTHMCLYIFIYTAFE